MEQQIVFDILKATFISAPILAHFDLDYNIVVETDASHYISASVLSQYNYDNILYPIAYFSKKKKNNTPLGLGLGLVALRRVQCSR
jgi:hypothetical protein